MTMILLLDSLVNWSGSSRLTTSPIPQKVDLSWQVILTKFFAEWVKDPAELQVDRLVPKTMMASQRVGDNAFHLFAQRVTHGVWQMKKLHLAKLEKAFAGK